jgi:hypothetical protein
MVLKKGFSKASMKANFSKLKDEGYPPKQRVAIVLSTARKAAKAAGKPSKGPKAKGTAKGVKGAAKGKKKG